MLLNTLILYPRFWRKLPTWDRTPPFGSTTTKEEWACKSWGVSQKRVLPEPDDPMTQVLRFRALAGILGRVFMVRNSVPVRMTLFSNLGSTKGLMSFSFPHRAEPYSSSRRNFLAFLLFMWMNRRNATAPTIPTSQSTGFSPGAKSAKAGPMVWPIPITYVRKPAPAASR